MTKLYTDFLPDVLPYASDCPELVALQQIRSAAIEFCDRSDYLRYAHPAFDAVANVPTYNLTVPAGMTVARIMDGYHVGSLLTPISEDGLTARFPRNWQEQTGKPTYFIQTTPSTVTVVPMPQTTDDDGLRFVLSLRPSRDSTGCEDILFERFAEYIAAGARARLYEMRGQPFYDPQASLYYRSRFMAGVGIAKMERNRSLGRPPLAFRPRRSAI